ncbi:hypothetical protein [Mammaliicoccus sciuri]|uniref:hypothetical protein n=1 Tax=Mammaliicoccus sciuri TaxID=1296 RepID=UPI000D1F65CE|nr:hypothetical protein [Mammaliicoccus sciuri]MEB8133568.1 hypothetical protein [Mammaliicoccus sciuri]PTJ55015.1 hypothetical protein BU009_11465 [Mammaliicoccus sciuri]
MKLKADFFPYPVLYDELDDFIDSSFKVSLNYIHESPSYIKLTAKFTLNNPDIEMLITQNKANYAIHIEGLSSSYRKLVKSEIGSDEINLYLHSDEISGNIDVNTMVIANENISNYTNSHFNPEYYGDDFSVKSIEKGDILAFDTMATIQIDFSNKENPSKESMIRVSGKDQKYMSVDTDGDVIHVYLPLKDHNAYINLSKANKVKEKLLLNLVILPTLTVVLERIKQEPSYEDRQWYRALLDLLNKYGFDEGLSGKEPLIVAQQLLDYSLYESIHDFYLMEDEEDEAY